MAKRIILALFLAGSLFGCAGTPKERIVVQKVFVPVAAPVPAKLKEYTLPKKPVFIAPVDKKAVVGLDKENTLITQRMIHSLVKRVCELEAYLNIKNCHVGSR